VGISAAADIEQANNSYAGYGQGAAGYGKRWAAKFGDGRTSDYLSHAVSSCSLIEVAWILVEERGEHFVGIAGRAGGTVLQEFFSKRLTKNVPDDANP
jgi:hypothetical protein